MDIASEGRLNQDLAKRGSYSGSFRQFSPRRSSMTLYLKEIVSLLQDIKREANSLKKFETTQTDWIGDDGFAFSNADDAEEIAQAVIDMLKVQFGNIFEGLREQINQIENENIAVNEKLKAYVDKLASQGEHMDELQNELDFEKAAVARWKQQYAGVAHQLELNQVLENRLADVEAEAKQLSKEKKKLESQLQGFVNRRRRSSATPAPPVVTTPVLPVIVAESRKSEEGALEPLKKAIEDLTTQLEAKGQELTRTYNALTAKDELIEDLQAALDVSSAQEAQSRATSEFSPHMRDATVQPSLLSLPSKTLAEELQSTPSLPNELVEELEEVKLAKKSLESRSKLLEEQIRTLKEAAESRLKVRTEQVRELLRFNEAACMKTEDVDSHACWKIEQFERDIRLIVGKCISRRDSSNGNISRAMIPSCDGKESNNKGKPQGMSDSSIRLWEEMEQRTALDTSRGQSRSTLRRHRTMLQNYRPAAFDINSIQSRTPRVQSAEQHPSIFTPYAKRTSWDRLVINLTDPFNIVDMIEKKLGLGSNKNIDNTRVPEKIVFDAIPEESSSGTSQSSANPPSNPGSGKTTDRPENNDVAKGHKSDMISAILRKTREGCEDKSPRTPRLYRYRGT